MLSQSVLWALLRGGGPVGAKSGLAEPNPARRGHPRPKTQPGAFPGSLWICWRKHVAGGTNSRGLARGADLPGALNPPSVYDTSMYDTRPWHNQQNTACTRSFASSVVNAESCWLCHGRVSSIDVSYTDGGLSAPGRRRNTAVLLTKTPLRFTIHLFFSL